MTKKNGFTVWNDEFKRKIFTSEEIEASKIRVAVIGELVKARQAAGISQRQMEEVSGVKQPAIARLEKGVSNPTIDTILKMLLPLGKTLYVGKLRPSR